MTLLFTWTLQFILRADVGGINRCLAWNQYACPSIKYALGANCITSIISRSSVGKSPYKEGATPYRQGQDKELLHGCHALKFTRCLERLQ